MAKNSFYVPRPEQPEPRPKTGKQKLAALVTIGRGVRTHRLAAGVHGDQHGRPNRERDRGQNERADIARHLHDN